MQVVQVKHYIQRATDFFQGMQLMRGDEPFRNSAALLAIHSALSYSDALRIGLGNEELSADDHRKAADVLQKLLTSRLPEDGKGLTQLRVLLSKKTLVAYGNRRVSNTDYQEIFTRAERFAKWAINVGSQLNIEGWQHGDQ